MGPGDARFSFGSRRHTLRECWNFKGEGPTSTAEKNEEEKGELAASTKGRTKQAVGNCLCPQQLLLLQPERNSVSPSQLVTESSGFQSMHSSNPKVRSSPSGNTQSSPKSKQEVMVRPPTVMSPSGNPQLDSKFSNQGKPGGSASQSQPSPCDSKSGGHTPKALPGPGGSMGLKNGAGNGAKGKGKRERSISADSFDQRDPGTPNDDSDIKGMSISFLRLRGKLVFPGEGF